MNVYIARDGKELGEFAREDLDDLARVGELRPTDLFWQEGMENWIALEELLGAEAWRKPAPPLTLKQRLLLGGGIAAFAILLFTVVILWSMPGSSSAPIATKVPAATPAARGAFDAEAERTRRTEAIEDLRRRLTSLPSKAGPPLHTLYYDVAVTVRPSLAANVVYEAIITGSENTTDAQTEETTRRTTFELKLAYRDGKWIFLHYRGSSFEMGKTEAVIDELDESADTLPLVATLLGVERSGAPRAIPR